MRPRDDYLDMYQNEDQGTRQLGYGDVLNELDSGSSYSDDLDALALDDGIEYNSGQPPVMIR